MKTNDRATSAKRQQSFRKKNQHEPPSKPRRQALWITAIILGVAALQLTGRFLPFLPQMMAGFSGTTKLLTEIAKDVISLAGLAAIPAVGMRRVRATPPIKILSSQKKPLPPSFLRDLLDMYPDDSDKITIASLFEGHWVTANGTITSAKRLSKSTTVQVEKRGFTITLNIRDSATTSPPMYEVGDSIRIFSALTKKVTSDQIILTRPKVENLSRNR